ncbi:alpha-tocopherol transfer protein-like isoform X2 [Cimex lectularius]|uniref:CRAL-TRIO domain-containing protein n=1 Tax=Cimex lectularius TaxID=79782 RepID=A0A8I6RYB7_CIMLE|nr:alpha-tocopherol transfer protein-like isoform X2 [Cimex lectularius]
MQLKEFPFKNGGTSVPKERKEDVASVRNWLQHQAHLPRISDEHILLFLHSNYYSVEKTKNTIDSYFVIRAENPESFSNWDTAAMETAFKTYELASLSKVTPDGYKVILYRLKDTDPSKFIFQDALRAFFAYNDVKISEDGIVPGYIVLFDMKGCTIGHLARATTVMNLVKMFMVYIQECHPVRLKGVHILNTAAFMDKILMLIKPLMKSGLIDMLHMHSTLDSLAPHVPLDLLPEDYGGLAKPTAELHEKQYMTLKNEYSDWLKDSGNLIADLKKRPQKKKLSAMEGSFRSLAID